MTINDEGYTDMADEVRMSRKEAAAYLTSKGIKLNHRTLANKASNNNAGGGPSYYSSGWNTVYYTKADLDEWARGKVRKVK